MAVYLTLDFLPLQRKSRIKPFTFFVKSDGISINDVTYRTLGKARVLITVVFPNTVKGLHFHIFKTV